MQMHKGIEPADARVSLGVIVVDLSMIDAWLFQDDHCDKWQAAIERGDAKAIAFHGEFAIVLGQSLRHKANEKRRGGA